MKITWHLRLYNGTIGQYSKQAQPPACPKVAMGFSSAGVASEQHGFDDECRHCPISLEVFQLYRCFKSTVWKAWYVTRSFVRRSHGTCVCTMVQLDNTASRHNHQRVQKLRWDSVQPVWLRNNTDLTTNVDTVQFHSRCFKSRVWKAWYVTRSFV